MIPDVEERSHIERYVGSSLIAAKSPNGYGKQQYSRQFQNTRYPKFAPTNTERGADKNAENRVPERYPFAPKSGLYRNADSRPNCWSGYPLISFNAGRRDNQNADQARHYYANVDNTLKSYTNGKPSKCSYSDFVTNKQGVPLIQANKFQEKQWERENRNFYHKNGNNAGTPAESPKSVVDGRENRKNECTDENLANSENCLPRIIKPRKRRKKDRKPNAAFVSGTSTQTQVVKKLQDKNEKPIYKMHSYPDKAPDTSQLMHNVHLTLYRPKSSKPLAIYQEGNVSDLLISRSLVNLFSEETQLSITDDLRLDYLIGKETSDTDQSTFCNCRYCDPQGVVWDIRQRCFSPNLMPPVNAVGTKLAKNKDWSTTLKRSCSEPASKPTTTPVVSRVRALSDSYDTTNQNLQVSSEIVTSLNGHRDIEIKFFSSNTPTSKT